VKVLATYNFKGGVGKTSTCVVAAHLAARDGIRTLVWDLDPQGAASWIFRVKEEAASAREIVLGRADPGPLVRASDFENLDVLPASHSYRKLDLVLADAGDHGERLRAMLAPFASEYDLIVLDLPPTLSRLAESVFGAADALLAPTIPTPLSLRTLARLFLHLKDRERRPAVLPFFCMVDRRKALHRRVCAYAREQGLGFLASEIPYSAAVERMGVQRNPLHVDAPNDRAARAYRALWTEAWGRLTASSGNGAAAASPTRAKVRSLLDEVRSMR
jgi:cellulose biosynthesis protein BcsQ